MEVINLAPNVAEQLLQNAEDYGLAMALTATPEQIEQIIRRNELFERGFGICVNCNQASKMKLEFCESCGQSKVPF